MTTKSTGTPHEQLAREVTPELYRQIRRLWTRHSVAEDRRDLSGLLDTLTEDCVYEVVPTGQRWEGHQGARAFYQALLGALPDVTFRLVDIVIGPQGVIEVAEMTGTHQASWAGLPASGRQLWLLLVIHFPWDATAGAGRARPMVVRSWAGPRPSPGSVRPPQRGPSR
jgi:ketosteroid isomerase-like protein